MTGKASRVWDLGVKWGFVSSRKRTEAWQGQPTALVSDRTVLTKGQLRDRIQPGGDKVTENTRDGKENDSGNSQI